MISATIHGDTRFDAEQRDQHAGDEQLVGGRVQERAELARDVPAAREPAVDPVGRRGDAEQRGCAAASASLVAEQDQRHHHGRENDPRGVPAASSAGRAQSALGSRPGSPRGGPMLPRGGGPARAGSARRAAAAARLGVGRAQRGLHRRDPPGGHAQLAHAEPREQHRGLRVAGELAADADPAAVRVGRLDDRAISASTGPSASSQQRARAPRCRARRPSCTARGRWCRR